MKTFAYEIKIAETQEEKKEAFRLRSEVFKKELGNKLDNISYEEIETDIYDGFCDHLIIIDKTKNLLVGTYRLLLASKVDPKIGFYSEKIFNIDKIKRLGQEKEILELSRSCVHRDYREGLVINLLWNAIAKYTKENNVSYLFGSVRLHTSDPQEVNKVFSLIKQKYYNPEEFRVYPLEKCVFEGLDKELKVSNPRKIFFTLPPLVKGYLRLGVKICGLPAWNHDFGSVAVFILLDIENMSNSYKRHFLGP